MDNNHFPSISTVDFETTGKEASEAFAIEAALACPDDGAYGLESFISLPPNETIPPETSAVHHIIDSDLEGAPDWITVVDILWGAVSNGGELGVSEIVMVAHNAEYEQAVLAGTSFDFVHWVCTYKCALIAWPDAPSHSNEGLRYWLGFGTGRKNQQASHSALHDCKVTAGIYRALYGFFYAELCSEGLLDGGVEINSDEARNMVVRRMINISKEPAQLSKCPIGNERGKKWEDIDGGFLSWCLRQPNMREDVKHAATKELERRRNRGGSRGQ